MVVAPLPCEGRELPNDSASHRKNSQGLTGLPVQEFPSPTEPAVLSSGNIQ